MCTCVRIRKNNKRYDTRRKIIFFHSFHGKKITKRYYFHTYGRQYVCVWFIMVFPVDLISSSFLIQKFFKMSSSLSFGLLNNIARSIIFGIIVLKTATITSFHFRQCTTKLFISYKKNLTCQGLITMTAIGPFRPICLYE